MFADEGYINATIVLTLLTVASQAFLWGYLIFPPEGMDIKDYRHIALDGPFHTVSIVVFLIVWGIVAGITAIFTSVDFLSWFVTTIVASLVTFAVGKYAFMEIFLIVNFRDAKVIYFSETALMKAGWLTFLAPLIVTYPLALCFGWVYWVAAGVTAAAAIVVGYVWFET